MIGIGTCLDDHPKKPNKSYPLKKHYDDFRTNLDLFKENK